MRKTLENLLGKYRPYPYVHTHRDFIIDNRPVRFNINNKMERFRLQKWGWEKQLVADTVEALLPTEIFYDIGSSVGALSITAAMKLTARQVISFEPDPENVESLKNNFLLNKLSNYKIIPCAVGDTEGELELFTEGSQGFSPSLRQVNGIQTSIKTKIVTIDGLLKKREVPSPNVVKIDIEGAELMALKGMSQLLSSPDRPRMIVLEIHPKFLPAFDTNVTEIFRFVLDKNYQIDWMESRSDQILCRLTA